ncbi:hypothetical protein P175DRAFT_0525034 [Aspergillus ochraceoroseus IBT 24754]|uniref:Immediate-early protein n=2 Tax=Aspergillus ochraceoroseus TaxID=138278 RepID=A0A2T5LT67_9EURO|nr:uncharacterized protein P175DRAFT_0525034 [Aspergillus ochraceoroseus IBT 24754]KKK23420.1 hypothetical protein AOCH_004369 [Aspergillus ochraceoroseus]PTU19468.1 hypothetical protein P175DRAFT_0525034 [Aspergillus ochraceoroseus IBT 24754]
MVTATRRRTIEPIEDVETNGVNEINGKRKSQPANPTNTEPQSNKRRKKSTPPAIDQKELTDAKDEGTVPLAKKNHFRFDSEEPVLPDIAEPEEADEPTAVQDDEENSSDDEAPETVDNSAQLSRIMSAARKQERARQMEEQLKKEKRRQFDEARKLQAKSSNKRKQIPVPRLGAGSPTDDLVSESSETLQGSFTQDSRHPTLPTLLPDEILNAVPAIRPPTPPAETFSVSQKKPTKLRFLDRKEKAPKDIKMGDVAIRVLGSGARKQPNSALPPKASKSGRNAKDMWLKQARSTGHVNGLRMTSGGSKGFVRK